MQKIRLILSFDHELSLGGLLGSYEDNLFQPTEAILSAAEECGVSVTLFTDVLAGIRFREWGVAGFVDPYERQLRDALARGHEVELHLHPHWLATTMEGKRFRCNGRYSLHEFRDETYPNDIPGIVERGVAYLTEVCRAAAPDYACRAFRAGGFNLEGSADQALTALWNCGIRIDSSVAKGFGVRSKISTVRSSECPVEANWYAPLTGPIQASSREGMYEVPVVTSPRTPWSNATALWKRIVRRNRRSEPTGFPLYDVDSNLWDKIRRTLSYSSWLLSFDPYFFNASDLLGMLDRYVVRHRASDLVVACSVSHPKDMGPSNVAVMKDFVRRAQDRYGKRLEFCGFRDILRQLGAQQTRPGNTP